MIPSSSRPCALASVRSLIIAWSFEPLMATFDSAVFIAATYSANAACSARPLTPYSASLTTSPSWLRPRMVGMPEAIVDGRSDGTR